MSFTRLLSVKNYYIQKKGNKRREYEDAFYPIINDRKYKTEAIFAVSDGATEGMHSKKWANILVKTYCDLYNIGLESNFLEISREFWNEWKKRYIKNREFLGNPLQWYEEVGFDRGAFASLLGLLLKNESGEQVWKAVALGDTCLVQIRENKVIESFPLSKSSSFNNSPFLLASNQNKDEVIELLSIKGDWKYGDIFLLMTDALACWFLKLMENGDDPIDIINSFETSEKNFYEFVENNRNSKLLKNDDVTLIVIKPMEG